MFKKYLLIAAICFFLQPVVFAQSDAEIDAFMNLSGLTAQIAEFEAIVLAQFEDEKDLVPFVHHDRIRTRLKEIYSPNELLKSARKYLMDNRKPQEMAEVMRWLALESTQRINAMEKESNSLDVVEARERFFEEMSEKPPSEERIALLTDFDEITDATYNTVSMITNMYLSIILTMNPYVDEAQRKNVTEMRQIGQSILMQLMPLYKDVTLASNLFTYRNLTDEEVRDYIDFYESDSGEWFIDASYGTLNTVIFNVVQTLMEEL